MVRVYLIAAPEDEAAAEELARWLKQRGFFVRLETGKFAYPPVRGDEVTLALWSRAALMSTKRMLLTNRAIDAWEAGNLVMVKLEAGLVPRGLADLDMLDLTFKPARIHNYRKVAEALRAVVAKRQPPVTSAPPPPPAKSAPADPETPHLFVSYAHANKAAVYPLVDVVEPKLGFPLWIDRDDLAPGERWAGRIVQAIKRSRGLWLMCTEQAFASDHVRREVYLADKYQKPLTPVRLDDAEPPDDIEYFLVDRQWVELRGLTAEEERISALLASMT